jgi:adenylate kinase
MKLLIMGAAGSGKGTVAERIVETYHIAHISTGNMFRYEIVNETELGLIAKSYIDQGLLVPDEVTIEMVMQRIQQPDCVGGYLLDGFPRTLQQCLAFNQALANHNEQLDLVIHLDIADEQLIERITGRRVCPNCGATYHLKFSPAKVDGICDKCQSSLIHRSDDTLEKLNERLSAYHQYTKPVIEYYRSMGLVVDVDAGKDKETVWQLTKQLIG